MESLQNPIGQKCIWTGQGYMLITLRFQSFPKSASQSLSIVFLLPVILLGAVSYQFHSISTEITAVSRISSGTRDGRSWSAMPGRRSKQKNQTAYVAQAPRQSDNQA